MTCGSILEFGEPFAEYQFHHADRTVAVFGDVDLGHVLLQSVRLILIGI